MGDEKKLSKKKNIVLCIVSLVILCVLLFPIYWIVVTSLKTEQEIFQIPPTFWPKVLNLKSYMAQIESGDFNMFRSCWRYRLPMESRNTILREKE